MKAWLNNENIYNNFIPIAVQFYSTELHCQQQVKVPWPSLANSPWPTLRGDMQGTGRSEYIGPRTNNVIWKKDMPLGVICGPVIGYDDNLYMGSRSVTSHVDSNYFYAVDRNGNDLWTFTTETLYPNNVGPLVGSDSTIFFGSRNSKFYSLDFYGSEKWNRTDLPIGVLNFTISRDKSGKFFIPIKDTIVVISSNGNLVRKIPWSGIYFRGIMFSPSGDTMYFKDDYTQVGYAGSLKSTDLDGNVYWSFNPGLVNWGLPLIDNNNTIYTLGRDTTIGKNFLFAVSANGDLKWKYDIEGFNMYTAPTIDKNGNIIFHAFINGNREYQTAIISLDYNGNENWKTILDFENDTYQNWINHELVCDAEGKVYFGTSISSYFGCIDSDGTILWTLDMGDLEYDSCPAIGSDGTLYIGAHKSSTFPYHTQNLIAVKDSPTVVEDYQPLLDYNLAQNYPNPFNPETIIKYEIPQLSNVKIEVFDVLGRVIKVLVDEQKTAGRYETKFDASSSASGIYYYRIKANDFVQTKKMMLLK